MSLGAPAASAPLPRQSQARRCGSDVEDCSRPSSLHDSGRAQAGSRASCRCGRAEASAPRSRCRGVRRTRARFMRPVHTKRPASTGLSPSRPLRTQSWPASVSNAPPARWPRRRRRDRARNAPRRPIAKWMARDSVHPAPRRPTSRPRGCRSSRLAHHRSFLAVAASVESRATTVG